MKSYYFAILFILFAVGLSVSAQEAVVFPVEELGGCQDFSECADFCDREENFKLCTNFAEAYGMLAPEQAGKTRKMLEAAEMGGPGGCMGKTQCEAFCHIPENIEECIVFALEHDLMPAEERREAEMALQAIQQGYTPPACAGPDECDIYCSEPAHLEECLDFGIAAGFISAGEAEMVRKTGGKGPGDCRGKEECDAFCQKSENMQICMEFGIEHGLIPPEEIEGARMALEAIKKGVMPPKCRGQEECDKYCSQPEHVDECVNFAVATGMMAPEEAEMAKKMMKRGIMTGPGGCRGKEECEAFCDNPDNQRTCMEFAVKYELMPPKELENAKKMLELGFTGGPGGCQDEEQCDAYCKVPENQQECFEFNVKMGFISPEEAERMRKVQEIGPDNRGPGGCETLSQCEYICSQPQYMEECMNYSVEKGMMSQEEAGAVMMIGPGGPGGPGGCQGEEECSKYCEDPAHMKECVEFSVKQGMMPPEEAEKIFKSLEAAAPEMMEPMLMPEEIPMEGMPLPEEMMKQEKMMAPEEWMKPEEMGTFEEWQEEKPEEWIEPEWPEEYRPPEQEYRAPEQEFKAVEEGITPLPEEIAPSPGEETIMLSPEEQIQKVEPVEPVPVEQVPIIPKIEPVEEPQTFFDVAQNFLASVVSILGL